MTAEDLRKSILQQAIQGKLVPQDPNDEPASELLSKIRAEKERLIKEKKIKRDKNETIIYRGEDNSYYEKILATGEIKCIDDEIPFEIPEGWEWSRIREISQSYIGLTYKPSDVSVDGTIVLRSSNIQNGKILLHDIVRVSTPISEKLWVKKNDIIICARNGSKKLVGKSAIVDTVDEPMTFGAFMAICKTPLYRYVHTYLQSDLFFNQLRVVSGTTTINQLTQNNFNGFIVPIPPKQEQQRICAKLSEVLPLIERYGICQEKQNMQNRLINELLKKSILQEAIQGKLVPHDASEEPASVLLQHIRDEKQRLVKEGKLKKKDLVDSIIYKGDDNKYYEKVGKSIADITDSIPFEIPDSWLWCRLYSVADLYTGNSINETEKKNKYTNVEGVEYIATKDVQFDHSIIYYNGIAIPKQYVSEFRIAPANSILMCIEGGSAGRKIGILNQDVCFGNKLCCFKPYADISEYIYYYLQSPMFYSIFSSNKNGIIGGVSVNNLKQLLIPIPPLSEIKRIVNKLRKSISIIES